MRTGFQRLAIAALFAGLACSRGTPARTKVPDDLQRDLSAASSANLELANDARNYKPMRFVSPMEQTPISVPIQNHPTRRPVASNHVGTAPEQQMSPDPMPMPQIQLPKVKEETTLPVASVDDAPTVPMVAPRPAAMPAGYPAGGEGEGAVDIGTGAGEEPSGVIIRGGNPGDDHCVPRGRPRGGIPLIPRGGIMRPRGRP